MEEILTQYSKKFENEYSKVLELIKKYNKICVFRHIIPDFDALGSQLGLYYFLKENFKDKDIKLPLLLIFLILFMSSLFSMSYNSISYCLSLSLGYCLYHNHILNQNFQRSEYGEIKSYNSCLRNL